MQNVVVVGNLVEDPEMRYLNSGVPLCNLRVAVNTRRLVDGEWEDGDTHFYRATAWRDLAENIADSLEKGDRVMIAGKLQQRSWENDEGETRSVVEITVDEAGPSLRWATAEVQKKRSSRKSRKSKKSQRAPKRNRYYDDDEDPF